MTVIFSEQSCLTVMPVKHDRLLSIYFCSGFQSSCRIIFLFQRKDKIIIEFRYKLSFILYFTTVSALMHIPWRGYIFYFYFQNFSKSNFISDRDLSGKKRILATCCVLFSLPIISLNLHFLSLFVSQTEPQSYLDSGHTYVDRSWCVVENTCC